MAALRIGRPFGWREFGLALLGLSVVAALALGPNVRHGGFYSDDWANAATSLQPPGNPDIDSALSAFADFTIYRPVLVVYVPSVYFAFGMHMSYHLAFAAILAVVAAALFYAVLRRLGVPWIHAWLIAALTIVFPWSDSTRLWATADQETLSIVFALAGLLIALTGLTRHRLRWHAWTALFYLLSILTYEVTLPLIASLGVLYCAQSGWKEARPRWLIDVGIAVAGGIWVGVHTARTASGLGGDIDHLKQIVSAGKEIIGRSGWALEPAHTSLVLGAIATLLALGSIAYVALPGRFGAGREWGLRGWVLMTGGGLAAAALGWAMFIPADPYYTPSVYGVTNRVNGLAAFGLVLIVYGALGIVGSFIGQLRPRRAMLATVVTVLLGGVLLGSYTHVLRRHTQIWNTAFVAESTALNQIRIAFPRLPHETTLFTSSYPANQSLGVPILSADWDLDGMVKMEYDDMTLAGSPVLPENELACRAHHVALVRPPEPPITAKYGAVRLLDLQTGRKSAPRSQRECRRVVGHYVPGPLYLSAAY
jgi:hypothetical protein